jgi:hypothetical protein
MWIATVLAVTTLVACAGWGGALYEARVLDPYWPQRPGLVQPERGGVSRRRFWVPVELTLDVLLVASLILTWSHPEVRSALLVAVAAHVAVRLWRVADPAPAEPPDAARWTRRSLLRLPLPLVTCAALFFALMFGSHA